MLANSQLAHLYSDIARGRLVAVNVLGEPFFESDDGVVKVSPETGDEEKVVAACDFEFAKLDDCWTAATLKADWENQFEPVGEDHFLVPIIAFTLGGEFSTRNLMRVPVEEAIALYRNIRNEICDFPDGASVVIKVVR